MKIYFFKLRSLFHAKMKRENPETQRTSSRTQRFLRLQSLRLLYLNLASLRENRIICSPDNDLLHSTH